MKDLLKELRQNEIQIALEGDNLKLSFDGASPSPDLIAKIKNNKTALIDYLSSNKNESAKRKDIVIEKTKPSSEGYPLSSSQLRIWVLSQSKEDSISYNLPLYVWLEGEYDIALFRKAIEAVFNRHEILRTVFRPNANDEIRQWVLPSNEVELNLDIQDLSHTKDAEEQAMKLIHEDFFRPFELTEAPLIRLKLFKTAENKRLFYYNMHHIISDGWSMNVLAEDTMAFYKALLKKEEANLPQLNLQYKDYASWQINELSSAVSDTHRKYWRNKLSGNVPVLNLPSFSKRPQNRTFNGHEISTTLDKELTVAIRNYVKEQEGTLFVFIIASINVLFHRYTQQEDILLGTPIAGRNHPEFERQIGCYMNTLTLRNSIKGDQSFDQLFNQVKKELFDAYAHQDFPFDRLVEELKIERDSSRHPLFDVMIVLQNYAGLKSKAESLNPNRLDIVDHGDTVSKFDAMFTFEEGTEFIDLKLVYNSDIYLKETMEELLHHFKTLSVNLIKHSKDVIGKTNYLSSTNKQQLLTDFNDTKKLFAEHTSVLDLFEEQVSKQADNTALVFKNSTWTYKELNKETQRIANYLITECGLKRGSLVAIQADHSAQCVIAILGILKAGAAFVPIATDLPEDRKAKIIHEASIKILITDAKNRINLEFFKDQLLVLEDVFEALKTHKASKIKRTRSAQDLVYVLYTSGSTGEPKGVMVEHATLLNYLEWAKDYYVTSNKLQGDFGLFTTLSFDLTMTSLFLPLVSGYALTVFPKEDNMADTLVKYMEQQIAMIKLTPAHVDLLKEYDLKNPSLRLAILGGEALLPRHVEVLRKINPGIKIYNEYGPTEATIGCIVYDVAEEADRILIGTPIANTQIYLLDDYQNLVPAGVTGEIYIGGKGVAKGYLNRPELTASRFIDNPYEKGKKLYKTGDIARRLPDGNIDYRGRNDNQVKIRGYRIELDEIESALSKLTEVEMAVVLVKTTEFGDKELIAYYSGAKKLEDTFLKEALLTKLPHYMIPNYFIHVEKFSLTTNGKIDKKALPGLEASLTKKRAPYLAPRDEKEKAVVEVWEEVLNKGDIGVNDNFLFLGGDSIKCILIASKLKRRGFQVKIADLMKTPVLSDVAKVITSNTQTINQEIIKGNVELTPIQKHFLYSEIYPNKAHYNQSLLLDSKIPVDINYLDKSLTYLINHHDALRMAFKHTNGDWSQENRGIDHKNFTLDFYDLKSDKHGEVKMGQYADELQSGINLENGPLFKVGVFRLENKDRILFIIHHLVVDGVSWRIILEDLDLIYKAVSQNKQPELSSKTDAFQKWAAALKTYANSDALKSVNSYWKQVEAEKVKPIYKEIASSALQDGKLHKISFTLDQQHVKLLKTKTHQVYNTEINDIFLAALGESLHKIFGIDKVVLEMEGHGREEILENLDINRTVGWFTSLFPFVLNANGQGTSVMQNLIEVKESLRKVPQKGIGYGILKYLTGTLNQNLETSIVFNYLGEFERSSDSTSELFTAGSGYQGASFALENVILDPRIRINAILSNGVLQVELAFNERSFETEKVQALATSYQHTLTSLIETLSVEDKTYLTPSDLTYPNLSISELSVLNKDLLVEDVYPLSPLQAGIFYHWLSENGEDTAYLTQRNYKLKIPKITVSNIEKSFAALIERHPILRTGFNSDFDVLLQVVKKTVSPAFLYKDISNMGSESTKETYLVDYKKQDIAKSFSQEDNSLIRLSVIKLNNEQYEFIWTIHHILMDGWCNSILINEFYQILMSLETSVPFVLPPITPYVNYINWLGKLELSASKSYWKSYLSDYETKAILPFEKNHSKNLPYAVSEQKIKIDAAQFDKLKKLGVQYNFTENTIIQTAWGFLLSKYNNSRDVVFGSVVSGRPEEIDNVDDIVGLFINTVPVRVQYSKEMNVLDLIRKQQEAHIAGLNHHYVSLSDIQAVSDMGNDLIDHIFLFQNYLVKKLDDTFVETEEIKDKLSVISVDLNERTHYDFNIMVMPLEEELEISINYNGNVYQKENITHLLKHLENVIDQFVNAPEKALDKVEYINSYDRAKLLQFNSTKVSYPLNRTILDDFRELVAENPSSVAVSYEGESLSYKDLDIYSNQLADYLLRKYKVEKGDLIGIHQDRSHWMLVSILGILKSGGAYVPIDMEYPKERIVFIQQDSGYKVCLDAAELEVFKKEQSRYSQKSPVVQIDGANPAYAIFTSGSTGRPKGVLNRHESLYNRLLWMRDGLSINQSDVLIQKTPYTFDVSVWELLMLCVSGSHLVFTKPGGHKDPVYLHEEIEKNKVSVIHFVPSMLGMFLEVLNVSQLKSLKQIVCSGEVFPGYMVARIQESLPWVGIQNLYGPTEAAIDVTWSDLTRLDTENSSVTIGKPVANTRIHVVDQDLNPQAIGVAGELLIEGLQVASGYLNRPELSAEKFIESPFSKGERVYRTGDLCKWLPNGDIAYLGRLDHQVKIRGNRIELGEIEYQLDRSGLVDQGVVIVKSLSSGDKTLLGFVKLKDGATTGEVYDYLKSNLPEYMVPSRLVVLEVFPMTSSGKVNRKELLSLLTESNKDTYQLPSTELEKEIWSIWEKVLEHGDFGVDSNFFRVGGDSILSIRLISRLNKGYGLTLKLGELYVYNTIQLLIDQIETRSGDAEAREEELRKLSVYYDSLEYDAKEVSAVYPMNDIQRGMVYTTLNNPGTGIYHDQFVYTIPAVEDERLLMHALEIVVAKHETLRTSFDLDHYEEPLQVLHKNINVRSHLQVHDLRSKDQASQQKHIEQYISKTRGKLFDFSKAPLWQIDLFTVNEQHSVYVLQFHHSILDGWSVTLFNTELLNTYQALLSGTYKASAPLAIAVKAVVFEEKMEKENQALKAYWKEHLKGYRKLDFFTDEPMYKAHVKELGKEATQKLRKYTREVGLHHRNILFGAFVYVLRELSLEEDFVLGQVSNNRPAREDGDVVLGCFLNTLPLRIKPFEQKEMSWESYFLKIEEVVKVFKQKDRLTMYEISKLSSKEKSGENPFFDIIYNYIDFNNSYKNIDYNGPADEDTENQTIHSYEQTNTFLDINVRDHANGDIEFQLVQTKGFKASIELETIAEYVEKVLNRFLDNPGAAIDRNQILNDKDQSRRYWHELLKGELPVLNLPKQVNKKGSTQPIQKIPYSLSADLNKNIEAFIKKNKGSVFNYLLSGFTLLLHRYTGQDDVLLGLQQKNKLLVIRSKVDTSKNFIEYYTGIGEQLNQSQKHALTATGVSPDNLSVLIRADESDDPAQSDLELAIKGSEVILAYHAAVYEESFMISMMQHYVHLMSEIMNNLSVPVGNISYMDNKELQRIVKGFNETSLPYSKDKTLLNLFEEQVLNHPNNTAVVFEEEILTYQELNEKANQFANYLKQELQVQNQDFVGVKLPRTSNLVIAILGVLKTGSAYIPLDLNYPDARISYIEKDSQCKCIIDETIFKNFINQNNSYSKDNPAVKSKPDQIAYVIYTSGTTGNPKGVLISNANAVALLAWAQQEFDAQKVEVVYASTSHCFDLSVFEMFYPLSIGKCIRVLDSSLDIPDVIERDKNILINTVPSSIRNLLDRGCSLENVNFINLAGEPFPVDIAESLLKTNAEIRNLYGPSEDTTYSTTYKLSKEKEYTYSIPIGKPINNTQAYILDAYAHPVPVHIPGKIYLAGDGLTLGYLNNPENTQKRFIENPFSPGQLMYDTGDWGKWSPDGNMEYLGRNDNQVKVRGYRIELGEIEHALLQFSENLKQVVVNVAKTGAEQRLVAYYSANANALIDKAALKDFLAERLPHYMIPSYYKALEEMPLNANGKIDKKALPPITEDDLLKKEYIQPRNEMEEALLQIIGNVLGVEVSKIGIADNFFDLGLDSLVAIKVLREINAKFNLSLRPLDLFQYPNVQSLMDNVLQEGKASEEQLLNTSESIDSIIDIF